MMGIVLSTSNLTKIYNTDSGKVNAVNGVSFNFDKGRFYVIMGSSGSGKSTLLHILSGLDRPTTGTVFVNQKNLFAFSDKQMSEFRRREMGFIFQQFNLLDDYRIEENICMPLTLDRKKTDRQTLLKITDMLGISDQLKKFPAELSGGQQQRVAIARSLIASPSIIFADEPTGNLDKKNSENILQLLRLCVDQFNLTLIMVTHDPLAAAFADNIIHLEDGLIINTAN